MISDALKELVLSAQKVVVLTGAGISAESGVPTFREAQTGLWAQYDPQALATRAAFRQNPQLVWEWYGWRRELVSQAAPNPGHAALAQWETAVPNFTLITQNVDGLHAQAGSQNIIELHGNIMRTKCFDNDHPVADWAADDRLPPHCPTCDSLLRPDVVWFGESLSQMALYTAVTDSRDCDLFLSVGTSSLVQPAASLPFEALQARVPVVEININETPLTSRVDYHLSGPSGEILPELLSLI